jgi:hypothetical protein
MTHVRPVALAVVLVLGWSAGSFGTARGAELTSDRICPEATQYVMAFGKLRGDNSPQQFYEGAKAAADAYARCSKDKLASGFHEAQHYADLRTGGFLLVAARALTALNRADEARGELQRIRPLVQQIVDWQTETTTPPQGHASSTRDAPAPVSAIGSDHHRSIYRTAASDLILGIDAQLATIERLSRDAPRPGVPQPSPSTGP